MVYKIMFSLVCVALGIGTAVALAAKPSSPPGQDPCSHGNSNKPCKPDPQPEHGKDCEPHGKGPGGKNEDHCAPVTTTEPPTTTTEPPPPPPPTTTTPTTTTTTPTTTTTTPTATTTTPGTTTTAPTATTTTTTPSTTTTTTTPTETTTSSTPPKVIVPPKSKPKPKKPNFDECVPAKNYTLNCGGVIVVPGKG